MSEPLKVADLLHTGADLAAMLAPAVTAEKWCDAFLLSAGLLQLTDDGLHPDPFQLRRAASYLGGRASLPARTAGLGATALASALELHRLGVDPLGPRRRTTSAGRLLAARPAMGELTITLASAVLDAEVADVDGSRLHALVRQAVSAAPMLGADVARLPACFSDFDLHSDDITLLAHELWERARIPPGPVCVVGVRTAGSYLAPLCAAALRQLFVPDALGSQRGPRTGEVLVLTHRPGHPFLAWERRALRETCRAGGHIVVTDDPPGTGTSLAATLQAITGTDVPRSAITLAVPLFTDEETLPAPLQGYSAVLAPWPSWSLHGRLEENAVAATLSGLLGDDWHVDRCERRPVGAADHADFGAGRRDHVRARYHVQLTNKWTGWSDDRGVLVEGAGLGYLGGHALAIAEALPGHLPAVYGLVDGLLYREWLPERQSPVAEESLAGAISAYVADRQQALPARIDPTWRMRGREPVWEVAAELLSRPYGWAAPATRLLLEAMTRRLLAHHRPSVVDGETRPSHWLPDPSQPGSLRKVDFHQRAFGHWGLACYDAAFDLAGAACEPISPTFPALLRAEYEARTGQPVDQERWLLYRLAQLWRLGRAGDLGPDAVARHSAAAVHEFLAHCYLDGLTAPAGPLCAIDLDGVLETDRLGYPCVTPIGALTLRALRAHGYRVVLATGRGLDEARDRCAAFGLAGAVAEYGTVVHSPADGGTTDLRSSDEKALLRQVRQELAGQGVALSPTHAYAVRARLRGRPLPEELISAIPLLADPRLQIIQGQGQTDVTVARLDKGTALAALAGSLASDTGTAPGLALAVGDTAADLTMLGSAAIARSPRNADAAVRAAGITVTRHAYQLGLADACADLLGHRPGRCPVCRPPRPAPRTRDLLALLAPSEAGLSRLALGTARVALRTAL
jgi:hydroxymethylpyrimidine pyrophosphatase-like HAD family hydrolase